MARRPPPLPPELRRAVLARSELLAAGVSLSRLRCADLMRIRRGLYARRGEEVHEADVAAALQAALPGLVVLGVSAARLLGIPLPGKLSQWSLGTPVEMAVGSRGSRGSSDGVVRFHALALPAADVQTLRLPTAAAGEPIRLRTTGAARIFRDLADVLDHGQLVAAGDSLVRVPRPGFERRSTPWTTIDALEAQCTGPHARKLRRAVADVRVGSDSVKETELRLAFCAAGLPEPLINRPLVGPDGPVGHDPDFLWPQFRLCGEYDGRTHSTPEQIERDVARAVKVERAQFTEIRFAAADAAHGCARAVRRTRDALRDRGWNG
ncbi:hypothetical protein [Brachybacterium hainanense]|uniref:Transcriptional regulator, AbiEi antitoxin, Type IV TA system n=1 Tax=Brachybacterium hainanense TaxID=1541174 RepID=A0ABV6R6X8_9MICO